MNRIIRTAFLVLIAISFIVESAFALNVKLIKVVDGLNAPLELKTSPDGTKRRFIIEQTGKIKILMPNGQLRSSPFLDLSGKIVEQFKPFDERGLLGLAFHPDYGSNGKFYVYYSVPYTGDNLGDIFWGDHTARISEFRVSSSNPNAADLGSEKVVLEIFQPQFNHNGGSLHFGPDGYLYISVGDGGYADDWSYGHNRTIGNGQDLNTLLGKILRIDVNKGDTYEIPSDNPFANEEGARGEIWAYGFRNPWRMRFDMGGWRQLFVADVGQNSFEEISIVTRGGNYGWRIKEGKHCFNHLDPNVHKSSCNDMGLIDPIIEYNNCGAQPNGCKGISVSGGAVYRGSNSAWTGKYFFGDWSKAFGSPDGHLFVATESDGKWVMEDINVYNMKDKIYILAVVQDGDGEVYALTSTSTPPSGGGDTLYKITP